jgi:hypothetical protein
MKNLKSRTQVVLALLLTMTAGAPMHGAESLPEEARRAMARAAAFMQSIATEGGYLWRYSPDLKERAGENPATATQIWVQPPGTPAVGMAFLRAYEATSEERHLDAAKMAADALVAGQLESGGWDYLVEFDPKLSEAWYRRSDVGKISAAEAARRKNISTYDDDNTQSALRLLMAVADKNKSSQNPRDMRIREARDYGLAKLVAAQLPNGGWPQRWNGVPVNPKDYAPGRASVPANWAREYQREPYYGHATLNDQTLRDCVMTLLEAGKRLDKPEFRAAAVKGGEFLLRAQLPEPQPAWAQQYNAKLEPAWARAFEPPAACSSESAGAMHLLVDLYLETGADKFLEPLPRAIAWFKRSEIEPGRWARFSELGTNQPIYGDRDGKIYYRVEDISPERQRGYAWKGTFNVARAIAHYEQAKQQGRAAFLIERDTTPEQRRNQAKAMEPRVRAVIAALDAQGRWLTKVGGADAIQMQTFVENLGVLSGYLEMGK